PRPSRRTSTGPPSCSSSATVTERSGTRAAMSRTQRLVRHLPWALAAGFCVAFVLLPLGIVFAQTVVTPDGELSLSAWGQVLATDVDRLQMRRSLELGCVATVLAFLFGFGHAWLTVRTDVPAGRWLAPLGVAPLVIPPILVAMGFTDLVIASGFWLCALLLGVSYAPFVAVLTARGLRAVDGRQYEAALVARGRGSAERWLFRAALPEIAAGCLFAFVFVVSEHGVPEFLTVKGKTWHTYAEGVYSRWIRRAMGVSHEDLVSPFVTAVPLVLIILVALWVALRLRARTDLRTDKRPLPVRSLRGWRWPALLLPITYLT